MKPESISQSASLVNKFKKNSAIRHYLNKLLQYLIVGLRELTLNNLLLIIKQVILIVN